MEALLDTLEQVTWSQLIRWATIAVVLAVGAVAGLATLRARVARHGRQRRIEYGLLPSPEFETTNEAVIRFATQLGRARRATGIMHHPDANSVRLRFQSVGDGLCLMSMSIPEAAAPGIRRALYPDVESRPLDEVIASLEGPHLVSGIGPPADPAGTTPGVEGPPRVDPRPPVAPRPPAGTPPGVEPPPPAQAPPGEQPRLWVHRPPHEVRPLQVVSPPDADPPGPGTSIHPPSNRPGGG